MFRLGRRQLGIGRDARSVEAVLHSDPDPLDGGQIIDDALGVFTRCLPFGLCPFLSHRVADRLGRRLTLSWADREATGEHPEGVVNDLTAIRGIGITMQNRLNRAGITTYAQLAEAKPQHVREALGKLSQGASVEAWISQVQKLVASK